jgi:hypothetical protein
MIHRRSAFDTLFGGGSAEAGSRIFDPFSVDWYDASRVELSRRGLCSGAIAFSLLGLILTRKLLKWMEEYVSSEASSAGAPSSM